MFELDEFKYFLHVYETKWIFNWFMHVQLYIVGLIKFIRAFNEKNKIKNLHIHNVMIVWKIL